MLRESVARISTGSASRLVWIVACFMIKVRAISRHFISPITENFQVLPGLETIHSKDVGIESGELPLFWANTKYIIATVSSHINLWRNNPKRSQSRVDPKMGIFQMPNTFDTRKCSPLNLFYTHFAMELRFDFPCKDGCVTQPHRYMKIASKRKVRLSLDGSSFIKGLL